MNLTLYSDLVQYLQNKRYYAQIDFHNLTQEKNMNSIYENKLESLSQSLTQIFQLNEKIDYINNIINENKESINE